MHRLVAIVGPTGVGKSRLALRLAIEFGGEIVSADSRHVYRHMDIGTAKPSLDDQLLIPHHLIDIIDPNESFSLAEYQRLALEAIRDISRRHKLPFLVGGTGQYVWAVLEGWQIPEIAPDTKRRAELESRAANGEADAIYQELVRTDPDAAQKIDPRNVRRVIRALEVSTKASSRSSVPSKMPPPFQTLIIGLTARREDLYRQTDARVDKMVERGFIEEVKQLANMGYGFDLPAMSAIGYRQLGNYLLGKADLKTAVQQIKTETHRFIRHQYNWFRPSDERIRWFDSGDSHLEGKAASVTRAFLDGV